MYRTIAGLAAVLAATTALVIAAPTAPTAAATTADGPITPAEVLDRAQHWVNQGHTYLNSSDKATWRTGPVGGERYRRDCSGLVSMVWHLKEGYYDTSIFENWIGGRVTRLSSFDALAPGDAILRVDFKGLSNHVELFAGWKNPSRHADGAYFYSFNTTGETVRNPYVASNNGNLGFRSYSAITNDYEHAIRYNMVQGGPVDSGGRSPASVVDNGGTSHVFATGQNGRLKHWWRTDTNWDFQEMSGPTITDTPSVTKDAHVFARGSNGMLQHWFWNTDHWTHHEMNGPAILGSPFATNDGHVWARGVNGGLQHWFWNTDHWAHHEMGGATISDSPTAVNIGAPHVFATGSNGKLQHWFWNTDHWTHHEMNGPAITGTPAATPDAHIYARGSNGMLQHWFWNADHWAHHEMNGPAITGSPTAATNDGHIYARGSNGMLQH